VLNALLLDPVAYDLQVLERLNTLLRTLEETLQPDEMERVRGVLTETRGVPYRELSTLVFRPSQNIGRLAHEHAVGAPARNLSTFLVRQLADLGADIDADLLSFILFDGRFAAALSELGRGDAHARAAEIDAFFTSST